MRLAWLSALVACGGLLGCVPPTVPAPPSPSPAGWMRVSDAHAKTVPCGELPMLVDVSHANISLTGRCGYVRVIGEHDDVVVEVIAGGTIDITGAHDDVYWKQSSPGPAPNLLITGPNNTFHPPPPR